MAAERQLRVLIDVHGRCSALYVLDASGDLLASVGDPSVPEAVPGDPDRPGMEEVFRAEEGTGVLPRYSPLDDGSSSDTTTRSSFASHCR